MNKFEKIPKEVVDFISENGYVIQDSTSTQLMMLPFWLSVNIDGSGEMHDLRHTSKPIPEMLSRLYYNEFVDVYVLSDPKTGEQDFVAFEGDAHIHTNDAGVTIVSSKKVGSIESWRKQIASISPQATLVSVGIMPRDEYRKIMGSGIYNHYPVAESEIKDTRSSGRSTRYADQHIQTLFTTGSVATWDHHGTRKSNLRLLSIVESRLLGEHGMKRGVDFSTSKDSFTIKLLK